MTNLILPFLRHKMLIVIHNNFIFIFYIYTVYFHNHIVYKYAIHFINIYKNYLKLEIISKRIKLINKKYI